MQITDVRVRKVAKEGKLKAVVSITMDEEFVVHDIKVIEGEKGLFIAMPSKKAVDGEYRDIAHPINSGTREKIQSIILENYEKVLEEAPEVPQSDIRCAAGREIYFKGEEKNLLRVVDSIFASGYLTAGGQGIKDTIQAIEDAGFTYEIESA